jgi:hypothetical protein
MPKRKGGRGKLGKMYGADLDLQIAKEVTPIAQAILREEHGIDHRPGVRDDLCPLCIKWRKANGRK